MWAKIAETWNNPTFEPIAEALANEHTNFSKSETITHNLIAHMTPATAEKVQLKWNEAKNELTRIIGNWERSGQGEGVLVTQRSVGMFNDRAQHALNTCRVLLLTITVISSIFRFSWKHINSLRRRSS